jgi:hypothetical protein
MASNQYHFITHWRVEGTCGEVADIIGDAQSLSSWWPSVYLKVVELEPPDSRGIGRRVGTITKGWLPYTIEWEFTVVESRYPHGLTVVASGEFDGRGVWTFEQNGSCVDITYDWRLRAEKPLLRRLSSFLKPLFASNHRWAMARGEESLKLELLRRRTLTLGDRTAVPPPPGPVTYAGVALVAGAVAVVGALGFLMLRQQRRRRL